MSGNWQIISLDGRKLWCRMYATAAARSDGLLLLCGGRDSEGTPMGDAYGLARHRDGRWEWAAAPGRAMAEVWYLGLEGSFCVDCVQGSFSRKHFGVISQISLRSKWRSILSSKSSKYRPAQSLIWAQEGLKA